MVLITGESGLGPPAGRKEKKLKLKKGWDWEEKVRSCRDPRVRKLERHWRRVESWGVGMRGKTPGKIWWEDTGERSRDWGGD